MRRLHLWISPRQAKGWLFYGLLGLIPFTALTPTLADKLSEPNDRFTTFLIQQARNRELPEQVSVVSQRAWIMSGRTRIASVPRGTILSVQGQTRGWFLVRAPSNGKKGYISASSVRLVPKSNAIQNRPQQVVSKKPKSSLAQTVPFVLQTGHTMDVVDARLSADGRWLATASSDHKVILWDTKTGAQLRRYVHGNTVSSVAFSPDAKRLVAGCYNGELVVWNIEDDAKHRLEPEMATINSVDYSQDGNLIVAAGDVMREMFDSQPSRVEVWNAKTLAKKHTLKVRRSATLVARFSPDSTKLATGTRRDGSNLAEVGLWDMESGESIWSKQTQTKESVTTLDFSPDGRHIAVGSGHQVRVLGTKWGSAKADYPPLKSKVKSLHFAKNGAELLIGSDKLNRWNWLRNEKKNTKRKGILGTLLKSVRGSKSRGEAVTHIDVSKSGHQLVVFDDKVADIMGPESAKNVSRMTLKRSSPSRSVAFHPTEPIMLLTTERTVSIWDLTQGRPVEFHQSAADERHLWFRNSVFSPTGEHFLIASFGKDTRVRGWPKNKIELRLSPDYPNVRSTMFSPDGRFVLMSCSSEVVMWDAQQGIQLWTTNHRWPNVVATQISPDRRFVFTAHKNSVYKLRYGSGRFVRNPGISHVSGIRCLCVSARGELLLTGGNDKKAVIWDTESGRKVRSFSCNAPVGVVAISPNGQTVAFGADDGTVQIWRAAHQRQFANRRVHDGSITTATFSPDGRWFVTGGEDGTFCVWNTDDWNETARILPPNGSEEWLVVTPMGKYDNSEQGHTLALRRTSEKLTHQPIQDQTQLHVPKLLTQKWSGGQ